jgi:hypothetical protein
VPDDEPAQAAITARAQVHATLAQTAATALQVRGADAVAWEAVAGPHAHDTSTFGGRHG